MLLVVVFGGTTIRMIYLFDTGLMTRTTYGAAVRITGRGGVVMKFLVVKAAEFDILTKMTREPLRRPGVLCLPSALNGVDLGAGNLRVKVRNDSDIPLW